MRCSKQLLPIPPFFLHFCKSTNKGKYIKLYFVGRISDSVIRQDHAILLGYGITPESQATQPHL